ncbi:MAG: YigZ family protein [Clostridia bacterium]|nr:YigZ family protein [Clostridia bacterium]
MDSYITVKNTARFEYEDRKSVFIGYASPVSHEADAIAFIEAVKKKFPDARHHVYAYVLRENSIMRFSDDREPQGTAGMPVLDTIRKNGCTDTVIVVVRYFGGTLLGTGGLVRAYTAAAAGALNAAEIITYDMYTEITSVVSYSDYQRLGPIFDEFSFRAADTRYTESVEISGSVRSVDFEKMQDKLIQATGGRIKLKKIGEKFDF